MRRCVSIVLPVSLAVGVMSAQQHPTVALEPVMNGSVTNLAIRCNDWQSDVGDLSGACAAIRSLAVTGKGARERVADLYRQSITSLLELAEQRPTDRDLVAASGVITFEAIADGRYAAAAVPLERVSSLMLASVQSGSTRREIVRACTALAISTSDYAAARYCSHLGVERFNDVVWHGIRLAWLAYRDGDDEEGERWLSAALAAAESPRELAAVASVVAHLASEHHARRSRRYPMSVAATVAEQLRSTPPEQRHAAMMTGVFGNDRRRTEQVGELMRKLIYWGPALHFCPPLRASLSAAQLRTLCSPADMSMMTGSTEAGVAGRLMQLWVPETGEPLAVAALQFPRDIGGAATGTSRLHVRQWSSATPAAILDTVVTVEPIGTSAIDLVAFVRWEQPVSAWSIRLTGNQGMIAMKGVSSHGSGDIGRDRLSDLLLAQPGNAVAYPGGDEPILVPLGIGMERAEPAELYFQVRGSEAGTATMALSVVREDGKTTGTEVSVKEAVRLVPGISEVRRTIGVDRMEPGWYVLRVELTSDTTERIALRTIRFRLR